jgi:telomere length regulation protein
LHSLLNTLSAYDQKAVFDIILRDVTRRHLQTSASGLSQGLPTSGEFTAVGGMAAMINGLVQSNSLLEAHLVHWLTSTSGDYAGLGLGVRRAVIATLAQKQGERYFKYSLHFTDFSTDNLQNVLKKSLANFGNKIQIQHDTMLQQECK